MAFLLPRQGPSASSALGLHVACLVAVEALSLIVALCLLGRLGLSVLAFALALDVLAFALAVFYGLS